jgi:hypothetical protein
MSLKDLIDAAFKIGIVAACLLFLFLYQLNHERDRDKGRYHYFENQHLVFDSRTGKYYHRNYNGSFTRFDPIRSTVTKGPDYSEMSDEQLLELARKKGIKTKDDNIPAPSEGYAIDSSEQAAKPKMNIKNLGPLEEAPKQPQHLPERAKSISPSDYLHGEADATRNGVKP